MCKQYIPYSRVYIQYYLYEYFTYQKTCIYTSLLTCIYCIIQVPVNLDIYTQEYTT